MKDRHKVQNLNFEIVYDQPCSENSQQCKECGELVEHCGLLNNVDRCSECSVICETCGISVNHEPIIDGICAKCR